MRTPPEPEILGSNPSGPATTEDSASTRPQRSQVNHDLSAHPARSRLYDVKVFAVTQEEEITATIAEGWEKVLQTTDRVWFRRPRWVP